MYPTMWSRGRDVDVEGHIVGMGNRWGGKWEWGGKEEGGERSVYNQPGTRVDRDRATRKGGIPSK